MKQYNTHWAIQLQSQLAMIFTAAELFLQWSHDTHYTVSPLSCLPLKEVPPCSIRNPHVVTPPCIPNSCIIWHVACLIKLILHLLCPLAGSAHSCQPGSHSWQPGSLHPIHPPCCHVWHNISQIWENNFMGMSFVPSKTSWVVDFWVNFALL